jgi:hypothetical protein
MGVGSDPPRGALARRRDCGIRHGPAGWLNAGRSGGRPRHPPWDRGWSGTRPHFTLRRPSRAAPEPSPPVRLKKPCARRLSGSSLLNHHHRAGPRIAPPSTAPQGSGLIGPEPEDACLFFSSRSFHPSHCREHLYEPHQSTLPKSNLFMLLSLLAHRQRPVSGNQRVSRNLEKTASG